MLRRQIAGLEFRRKQDLWSCESPKDRIIKITVDEKTQGEFEPVECWHVR
jgi:hypothetical protein